jgi:hypothetical protein
MSQITGQTLKSQKIFADVEDCDDSSAIAASPMRKFDTEISQPKVCFRDAKTH